MTHYICEQCGVQYADSDQPPGRCAICDEERQYINPNGQRWTTLEHLRDGHHNVFTEVESNLTSIRTEPSFGIGQTAFLIQTEEGCVLWDCISLIDDETIAAIKDKGGLKAIAISHPHMYGACVEWSQAFGGVPVYLHALDRQWVMRSDPVIQAWSEDKRDILKDIALIKCGGHFDGSTVLLWKSGANGQGVLFTSDTIYVVSDLRWVTFMHSYPNMIPLHPQKVYKVVEAVSTLAFDRLYSNFGKSTQANAKRTVIESAIRYIKAIDQQPYLNGFIQLQKAMIQGQANG
jgi:glyoxylase-like metal-dependent hydrolase (beta-lactamase superfamily II)